MPALSCTTSVLVCQRFSMVRISDSGPSWKKGQTPFVSQTYRKNNSLSSSSEPCQNSEKSNDPVPRKPPDRWQDGRKDRPYFTGSSPATARGLTGTTAVDWHFKKLKIQSKMVV